MDLKTIARRFHFRRYAWDGCQLWPDLSPEHELPKPHAPANLSKPEPKPPKAWRDQRGWLHYDFA